MQKTTSVEHYIERHPQWHDALSRLRKLLNQSELTECIKWGTPVYTLNNKNVAAIGAFKNHVGLWFFNGVFLEDKADKLVNAQEGKTKGMRQWNFKKDEDLDEALITSYINESVANQKAGKEIKPEKQQASMSIPIELNNAFTQDNKLKTQFESLPPYKQKEYVEHISSAKREATRLSRLNKAIPLILSGTGLNDKYR